MNIIDWDNTSISFTTRDATQTGFNTTATVLSYTLEIPEDHHYLVNLAINIANYTVTSNYLTINTFDVQNVEVIRQPHQIDDTCFDITYVKGHIATGCHIKTKCPSYNVSISRNVTGNTNCHAQTLMGQYYLTFKTFYNGKCTVRAYDIVDDEIQEQNGAAVTRHNVAYAVPISSSSTTPSPTQSSSIPSSIPSISPTQPSEPILGEVEIIIIAVVPVTVIFFCVIIIGASAGCIVCCLFKKKNATIKRQEIELQAFRQRVDQPN
jgi:hypothetical protein